ncbi:MAG: serine hydrolase [Bacteroidota bacterium]
MRLLPFLLLISSPLFSQDDFLKNLMRTRPGQFRKVIDHARKLEVQIIYTRIDRDDSNRPHFTRFTFNTDSNRYFYPASTVKFPMVLMALEKLHELGIPAQASMVHDSVWSGHRPVHHDTTAEGGMPSVAHYAKKILVVSDNDAYNRLYEFVGQKEANDRLAKKGYRLRLLHRLERSSTPAENRHNEPVAFYQKDSLLHRQPMLVNDSIPAGPLVLKGKGYYSGRKLVRKPMDFSYRNFFSLHDQQEILKTVIFPEAVRPEKRFNLRPEDHRLVLQYMSQLPAETRYPAYYKDSTLYDGWCKFLMYGEDTTRISPSIRIFNKVGDAYGYTIDNAYIIDFDKGIEFMLSAVIHSNRDGIFNDNKYEYSTVCFPFLRNLGKLIYDYELTRKRDYQPDLSAFRFGYDLPRR